MLRVGLTGGIGSGKTTVSNIFRDTYHIPIIDADEINRELLARDSAAYHEVIAVFGQASIDDNKEINRKYLREQVFSDPEKREKLENIIHPKVRDEISKQSNKITGCYCLIVIPLLIETNMQSLVDRILVIDCYKATQIDRIVARDHSSREQAEQILEAQVNAQVRLEYADEILVNNGTLVDLNDQILGFHQKYLALCA